MLGTGIIGIAYFLRMREAALLFIQGNKHPEENALVLTEQFCQIQ